MAERVKLEHLNSLAEFRASVRGMTDAELLSEVVGLEAAAEALAFVIREGATEQKARATRDGLLAQSTAVVAECWRRRISTTNIKDGG